jgi:hypothetical protein
VKNDSTSRTSLFKKAATHFMHYSGERNEAGFGGFAMKPNTEKW